MTIDQDVVTPEESLVVYGHDYCTQAVHLARALADYEIRHEWRDIMNGPEEWKDELRKLARGYLSVPTVIFSDGTVMVEPWPRQVLEKVGIEQKGLLDRLLGR